MEEDAQTKPKRWVKGMKSPNEKGRPKQPKTVAEVRELAREKTAQMVEVLSRVALNPKSPAAARVAAATSLIHTAWGRPHQSMDITHGAKDGLATLLDEINGRFKIRSVEGTVIRPAAEAKQPLLDHGQERQPDPVQTELGTREPDE